MTYATIPRVNPRQEENSEEIPNIELPRGKGMGNWDAIITLNLEDEPSIDDLPSDGQLASTQDLHTSPSIHTLNDLFSGDENSINPNEITKADLFIELANLWHKDTDYLSSPSRITGSEEYLKIISMGVSVVPLILQDLQERGGYWYPALRIISNDDPIPPEAKGNVQQMKVYWLRWGRDRGYIK